MYAVRRVAHNAVVSLRAIRMAGSPGSLPFPECVGGVQAAAGVGARCGGHALTVSRKQAIAGIPPLPSLKAIAILSDRLRPEMIAVLAVNRRAVGCQYW